LKKTNFSVQSAILAVLTTTIMIGCAPQAPATPTVDIVGTTAVQLAIVMLTQTAGAVTPTPFPPTETPTPMFTDTPAAPPTETPVPAPPSVITTAGCWTGPGDNYTLISNIEPGPRGRTVVTILGTGSEPGWLVIRNPYFNNPCWIRIENLNIDPQINLSDYPVMTPGP
jgi:hypothetical protein